MKYSFRLISSQKQWHRHWASFAPHAFFQRWEWGEIESHQGTEVWRYGLYDNATCVGIMQILLVRARRGSFLHVRHGPCLSPDLSENKQDTLYHAATAWLRQFAKTQRAWFVRISPLERSDGSREGALSSMGYRPSAIHAMNAELCWLLPLRDSQDTLRAGMRKSTRYEIKRAEKLGVTIRRHTAESALSDFFGLYRKTMKRHGFVGHKGIRQEFAVFAQGNNAFVYTAHFKGEVIASAIIIYSESQAIYRHGASIKSKAPGSHALQWQAIMDAKKNGCAIYNFWGIAPEQSTRHPWSGLTVFKKGFGGEQREYLHAHDLPVHPGYYMTRAIESYRKIRKGY